MRGRLSWEKNELDNILEYRYEKKKKFAVEKAVDILVNHTTPFRAFLPSTVICFIQVLNNRSILLLNFFFTGTRINIQRSTWTLSLLGNLVESAIKTHSTPFSFYSTPFHAVVSWAFGCHCERGLKPQTRLVTEKNANPKPEQQPHKTHTTIRSIIFMF